MTFDCRNVREDQGMFTYMNKQGVRSSEGFEVQRTGRFTSEYREGGRVITVHVEHGDQGTPCLDIVREDAFARWDHSGEINSPEEQARLLQNFKKAMEFQGYPVCV